MTLLAAARSRAAHATIAVALALALALVPRPAAAISSLPAGNLTANPSFSSGTDGWGGYAARVTRVRSRHAPDGRHVAVVRATSRQGAYTIDDSPDTIGGQPTSPRSSRGGRSYSAEAWVQAMPSTRRKAVGLVIREATPDGEVVSQSERKARLGPRFRRLSVTHKATAPGNTIDVYVRRTAGARVPRDAFRVDAISLVQGALPDQSETVTPEPNPAEPNPAETNPPSGGSVTTSQIALLTPQEAALIAEHGSKYRYVVIRDNLRGYVDDIRAANPKTKILLYKDVSFVTHGPGCEFKPFQGSGLNWCDVTPHENWFLHDKNTGERLTSVSYTSLYATNIGNGAYQNAWRETVLARLQDAEADGSGTRFDGVFMDDSNLYPGHGMDGRIAELSGAGYMQAAESFISNVAPQLRAAGFVAMPNLGMDLFDAGQRAAAVRVAQTTQAVTLEHFIRWNNTGPLFTDPGNWISSLTMMEQLQATGADYMAIAYGGVDDVQIQRYARATFLLGWNGKPGSSLAYRADEAADPFTPGWTTDIGVPSGERFKVGAGWQRNYSGGTVVINPSPGGSQQFNLGGRYRRPDGSCSQSVSLSATEALVMPSC